MEQNKEVSPLEKAANMRRAIDAAKAAGLTEVAAKLEKALVNFIREIAQIK